MIEEKELIVFEAAARMLKSVAHPVRINIIKLLIKEKRLPVNALTEKLGISQSMTSQHLASLRHVGVLACEKSGNVCTYFIKNRNVLKLLDCVEHCAAKAL